MELLAQSKTDENQIKCIKRLSLSLLANLHVRWQNVACVCELWLWLWLWLFGAIATKADNDNNEQIMSTLHLPTIPLPALFTAPPFYHHPYNMPHKRLKSRGGHVPQIKRHETHTRLSTKDL